MPSPAASTEAWARDPEVLERVFHAAMSKGDAEGVDAALRLMAVCDPRRAGRLFDSLKAALAIADVHDCHTDSRCCKDCETHIGCRCDGDYYGRRYA